MIVDLAFFRSHVWARLMVNIGGVLVFGAFYQRPFGRQIRVGVSGGG
jgi:hypothetical protein